MGRGEIAEPFLFCSHCTLLQCLTFLICSTVPPNTIPPSPLASQWTVSENLSHSVLRAAWTVIKNQRSVAFAEQILQRIRDEQELGTCELKNYFSQD